DLAVDAEAGDAAVGEDVEADVGEAAGVEVEGDGDEVFAGGTERGARDDLVPGDRVTLGFSHRLSRTPPNRDIRWHGWVLGGVEGKSFGLVAVEVGGVDDDAADGAGLAELDDAPVVGGRGLAFAAGFPAVHPLAAVSELAGDKDRGFGLE